MHRRVSLSAFVGVLLQRDRSIAGRLFVAAKGDALFVQKNQGLGYRLLSRRCILSAMSFNDFIDFLNADSDRYADAAIQLQIYRSITARPPAAGQRLQYTVYG